jgi:hypothetical protein
MLKRPNCRAATQPWRAHARAVRVRGRVEQRRRRVVAVDRRRPLDAALGRCGGRAAHARARARAVEALAARVPVDVRRLLHRCDRGGRLWVFLHHGRQRKDKRLFACGHGGGGNGGGWWYRAGRGLGRGRLRQAVAGCSGGCRCGACFDRMPCAVRGHQHAVVGRRSWPRRRVYSQHEHGGGIFCHVCKGRTVCQPFHQVFSGRQHRPRRDAARSGVALKGRPCTGARWAAAQRR